MKIVLREEEVLSLLKKTFPREMLPENYSLTDMQITGYSYDRQLEITIGKKEE